MSQTSAEILPPLTRRFLAMHALVGLAAMLVVAAVCSFIGQISLGSGIVSHPAWRVWDWPLWGDAVWQMRLMRLGVAATVGASLSAAGMALQGLLRNPLAEPYILGISSGAGVGVLLGPTIAAATGATEWAATPMLALGGALATCLVVYGIAQRRGRLDPYVLLLAGVIVNVFNGALMLGLMLFVERNRLLDFVGWGMGRVSDSTSGGLLGVCMLCVLAGWVVLLIRGAAFNTLGLGDDVAASSGVAVHWMRGETFVVVGLMTACAVALAGPVGFMGLIVPHLCRMIVGADHRRLVVVSGFAGAMVLMLADTLGRTAGPLFGAGSIPVGIITALSGGPFFIYLLRRRSREGQR